MAKKKTSQRRIGTEVTIEGRALRALTRIGADAARLAAAISAMDEILDRRRPPKKLTKHRLTR